MATAKSQYDQLNEISAKLREINKTLCCTPGSMQYNTQALVYVPQGSDYDVFDNYPNVHSISISAVTSPAVVDPTASNGVEIQIASDDPVTFPLGYTANFTATTYLVNNIKVVGSDDTCAVILAIIY